MIEKFSDWIQWKSRKEIGLDNPGIYILGRFDSHPAGKPLSSDSFLYIGETCGQSLKSRLTQFARSAFSGKDGHSGGLTFNSLFQCNSAPAWLYVAVLGVDLDEPSSSAYIRYVERTLIWQYVQNKNALPVCNKK